MFELIPSKDTREYLQNKGHEFADSEKATLAFNNKFETVENKILFLQELMIITEDDVAVQEYDEMIRKCGDYSDCQVTVDVLTQAEANSGICLHYHVNPIELEFVKL